MRWYTLSVGSRSKNSEKALKTKWLPEGVGGTPEHICETEPASAAPCPLCVHVVRTDGSYTKTPQANRSNFQKASQAQHGERDSVREREDKGMLENLSFQYYHGYEPKISGSIVRL